MRNYKQGFWNDKKILKRVQISKNSAIISAQVIYNIESIYLYLVSSITKSDNDMNVSTSF